VADYLASKIPLFDLYPKLADPGIGSTAGSGYFACLMNRMNGATTMLNSMSREKLCI
jgi:hypothetical protein